MKKTEKAVVRAAMNWYRKDIAVGCVRTNFTGQSRRLWDACAHHAKRKGRK